MHQVPGKKEEKRGVEEMKKKTVGESEEARRRKEKTGIKEK